MAKPEFIEVHEQDRIYTISDKVELKGIVSMNVSKSGTHRLNTTDGKKHIVYPVACGKLVHVEFTAEDWTF